MDAHNDAGSNPSRIPSVSLIVPAIGKQTDANIWKNVRAIGSAPWRSQVILIDPQAIVASRPFNRLISTNEITYRPYPLVFRNLPDALRAAKHETIAVLDSGVELGTAQWSWLTEKRSVNDRHEPELQHHSGNRDIKCDLGSESQLDIEGLASQKSAFPITAAFEKTAFLSGYKRSLFAINEVLVRLLLKTNKSEFKSGVVLMSRSQVETLLSDGPASAEAAEIDSREALRFSNLTNLLAIAKVNRIPIKEIESEATQATHNRPVSSNQLFLSSHRTIRFWWNEIMFPKALVEDSAFQQRPKRIWRFAAATMLFLATVSLLFSNLNYPLFEPDEARNAQLAMNIFQSGDWMSLTLAEEPYWDKPPGQIWAIATSYKFFGLSPFATRVPGALATTFTILMMLFLGERFVGYRAAFVGAVVLLLSSGFVLLGRYVTMDASLTACVFLMSLSLMLANRQRFGIRNGCLGNGPHKLKRSWLIIAGIAAGIGFIVKGPIVLVLGIPPVLMAFWLAGDMAMLKQKRNLLFFVPMLLIAGPWFLATAIVHPDFLTYFFWKHHVVRFADAFNHRAPFWYYVPAILLMMFPASYLLPSLIKFLSTRRSTTRNLRTTAHGFLCLFALWVIGFFSMSESKLPTYVLSSLPPIGLLLGVLIDKKILAPASTHERSLSVATAVKPSFLELLPKRSPLGLLGLTIAIVLVLAIAVQSNLPAPLGWLLIVCAALTALAILPWHSKTRPWTAWACFGILAFSFVLTSVSYLAPVIAFERSIHAATAELKEQSELRSVPVVFFGREDYGFEMTLPQEPIFNFENTEMEAMCKFLEQHSQTIIISSDMEMEHLRRVLPWKIDLESSESTRHLYFSFLRNQAVERSARAGEWKKVLR